MKPRNVKPKSRSLSSGPQKQAKRSISVKGKWKAVELDPCLFSEEGLEGLVCFEELTNYKLVDPEKAATKATKELKKKEERKKKKAKKRKASEEEQAEGCPAVESKEGGETSEPAKKKAKKKKKNKKQSAKEAVQQDNISAEVTEKEVAAEEEKREGETAEDDSRQNTLSNKVQKITKKQKQQIENAADVEPTLELKALEKVEAQKINKKQKQKQQIESAAGVEPTLELKALEKVEAQQINKKQKKKQKQQIKNAADVEPSLELQALEKVKSSEDNVAVPRKKKQQIKNWTHAALTGSVKNTDVSAWKDLFVPSPVLKALSNLGFGSPTPVQALALPPAIRDRMDILGAAETGSGKTLAFGIPMIHTILEWKKGSGKPVEDKNESPTNVESLYLPALKPELTAESISEEDEEVNMEAVEEGAEDVDQGVSEDNSEDDEDMGEDEDEKLGCVQVIDDAEFDFDDDAAAEEKLAEGQNQPLLGLVLTPTRELAVQVKHHIDAVAKFTDIKTVIVVGGMSAEKQRKMLKRRPEIVIATPGRLWDLIKERNPHLLNLRQLRCLVIDEADRMVERGHFAELDNLLEMLNTDSFNPIRQKFVFSATLTMAHTLPTRLLQKKKKHLDQRSKLEILMAKVGIKTKPKVIDLTRKDATVETLTETQLHCQKEEKDFYLYYFLLQYPGRTMVFANSIDCIKRLNSLLVILDCTPLPLHANMHQKQRLKNLERFAERESCVLLTTDVAARGLDIPDVQHVIHYQVPRTSETYVHRSGRTARANKEGLSLLLVGPDDLINFRKIHNTLGKDEELPIFPIESKCMDAIKERVNLARKIEKIEYHNSREKQHNSWFKQAAEALEVDLDDDVLIGRGSDEDTDREQRQMVQGMKRHLKHLISQPVFKNAIKTKYPTQMGKLSLPHLPRAGMESALTRVTMEQKKKLKLKKNVPTQQQKKQQQ